MMMSILYRTLICTCITSVAVVAWHLDPPEKTPKAVGPKATPEIFRVASMYGSEMVLQMEPKSAHIWGFGLPFSEIIVHFNGSEIFTTVSKNARWSVRLPPQPAGGPHTIVIEQIPLSCCGSQKIALADVMFGDVWLCGGGSNMAQEMNTINGGEEQVLRAKRHTTLRLFQVQRHASTTPQEEVGVVHEWETTEEEALLSYFPALCLLFGMNMADLHPERPIGLIEVAWGGTPIQAWASENVHAVCRVTPPDTGSDQYSDTTLWNGMIKPLTTMAIRGVIWHQGEANTMYHRDTYGCYFRNLISDWQIAFVDSKVPVPEENSVDFAFGYVQLGPSWSGRHSDWTSIRLQEADMARAGLLVNTFSALSYDLADGNVTDLGVHYRDKVTVASRLALAAKSLLYDTSIPATGPQTSPSMMEIDRTEQFINITFNRRIAVRGPQGFFYEYPDGSLRRAEILSYWSRGVALRFTADAKFLGYGLGALPCEHGQCAVYSDDEFGQPAAVFRFL